MEKKFPWLIGGAQDEYNTRMDGDEVGNLYICGMSFSKDDFLNNEQITNKTNSQGLFVQSIKAEGYWRWGKYLSSIIYENQPQQSYDITWLYSCKVAPDSSALVVSGSVNYDFTFFAVFNTSNGNLTSFYLPQSPYNFGQTTNPIVIDNQGNLLGLINKSQLDSWVMFKFNLKQNKVLWQYKGAIYHLNYTNGSQIRTSQSDNIQVINRIHLDEIRNESYLHSTADIRYLALTENYIFESILWTDKNVTTNITSQKLCKFGNIRQLLNLCAQNSFTRISCLNFAYLIILHSKNQYVCFQLNIFCKTNKLLYIYLNCCKYNNPLNTSVFQQYLTYLITKFGLKSHNHQTSMLNKYNLEFKQIIGCLYWQSKKLFISERANIKYNLQCKLSQLR
eukprot:403343806